jgi:hypothetical protein
MLEKYSTTIDSVSIIVTRKSDGKTLAFDTEDFDGIDRAIRSAAITVAKGCKDYNWG